MSQHLVGVLLKDKNFVPLCSAAEKYLSKPVFAYKDDFDKSQIPVYICKMKSEKDIEKIYKIGELKISAAVTLLFIITMLSFCVV